MRLYRICHVDHLDDYSGLGASYRDGGRWNEPGVAVLYFAVTASIAMLEMANYLPSPRLVPAGYRLGIYDSGSPSMERWTVDDLPSGWDRFPYPLTTQRMGSDWLRHGTASLLAVPSTTVPGGLENIVVVSPARLDAASIRLRAVHEHSTIRGRSGAHRRSEASRRVSPLLLNEEPRVNGLTAAARPAGGRRRARGLQPAARRRARTGAEAARTASSSRAAERGRVTKTVGSPPAIAIARRNSCSRSGPRTTASTVGASGRP